MERRRERGSQEVQERMGGIHRRFRRADVSGFSCDIAEGSRLHEGIVENISSGGFKIRQMDEEFRGEAHCYRALVAGNGKYFKLVAKPCWYKRRSDGLEIGFKILDATWEWAELLLAFEDQKDEAWGVGNA